jgi:hypothetical protein
MIFDQMLVGQRVFDQMLISQMVFDQMVVGQMVFDQQMQSLKVEKSIHKKLGSILFF